MAGPPCPGHSLRSHYRTSSCRPDYRRRHGGGRPHRHCHQRPEKGTGKPRQWLTAFPTCRKIPSTGERTERNISTRFPEAQKAARQWFKLARNEAANQGYEAKIICGTRTYAEQNDLYRQRPKVTNARGGQSWHNFGLAWDFGIFQDRNYLPNHPLYTTLGKLYAKIDGLEWGGTWKSFTDPPHLQLHQFGSISEARRSFET